MRARLAAPGDVVVRLGGIGAPGMVESEVIGSSGWLRPPFDVSEEHLHHPADMAKPAVPLRIVEHLLIGETGDDRP